MERKHGETDPENEPQTGMEEQEDRAGMAADSDEPDAPVLPAEQLVSEEEEEVAAPSEVEVLQEEIALLEQQLQQMRDRYIRAVADLDNARKRARHAITEARHQAVGGVLLDLLTLADNFERALETANAGPGAAPETKAILDGVALIYRQLRELLEKRGVKAIPAVGERFDPSRHEAVVRVPAGEDQAEGTVALEMQKGYMHGDRVLRPSRVGVAVDEVADDT
ncbi:MAG TPA: nucleotide exchange factor GrpE [Armatimonadota bacterium]|nr:nucleotide exchange factor GrpE [Armatimonadota bacterium]